MLKKNNFYIFAFVITCAFLIFPIPCFGWRARVIRIVDGDTITVLSNEYEQIKIRLYGIDAPEKEQPWGVRARQALSAMVFGRNVEIEDFGKDRYGRTVARVYFGGQEAGVEMVRSGMAWVFVQYCNDEPCLHMIDMEKFARDSRTGLWSGCNPVAPWDWRRH